MASSSKSLSLGSPVNTGLPERKKSGWKALYPSISTRITVPFLIIIIVVAAIGVYVVTHLVTGSIQERLNNQLVSSADAASNSIVDFERQQLATLRIMVFTDGVAEAIAARDAASLDAWLRPVAANAGVDRLLVFEKAGLPLLSLSRQKQTDQAQYDLSPLPDLSTWNGVQQVLGATSDTLGDKVADLVRDTAGTVLHISAPVFNAEGQLEGGISVGYYIEKVVWRAGEQALSGVTLYAPDGSIFATTHQSLMVDLPLEASFAARLMSQVLTISPMEARVLGDESYQVLYAPFLIRSRLSGILAVTLPSRYVVERSSTSRDLFGVLFASMFAIVAVMGLLVGRTITSPVARLVETTRQIREGDLTRRVSLSSPDELGELSLSFDHMTDQLVQRNREISDLYQAQVQETARREAVLASISDAVIVQNPNGRIILRNRTAEHLLQQVKQNPVIRREFLQLCKQPADLTEPKTVMLDRQYFSVLATPVSMPSGRMLGHVIVFRNITALIESERLKDEMILQLSHELRTPITAACGYIDLLQMVEKQRLSSHGQKFVDDARTHMTTLERMIEQVIDVSAILANQFTFDFGSFDLSELLHERIQRWKPLLDQRELALSCIHSEPIPLQGDARRIGQVIDYLVHNAYSYTLPGGIVRVEAKLNYSHAVLTVSDSGVGIKPEELEAVFERMYRGSSADAGPTDSRGLGLGLYLTKYYVDAHHGSIQIDSQINVGTLVTVYLPLGSDGN